MVSGVYRLRQSAIVVVKNVRRRLSEPHTAALAHVLAQHVIRAGPREVVRKCVEGKG